MTEQASATGPGRSGRKIRRAAGKLLLLLFTLSVCLAVLEFAVRRLFPFFSPQARVVFRLTEDGIALGLPGQTLRVATPKGDYDLSYRFNQDGLRDVRNLRDATEEDWIALGDSFTMGWGVEEEQRFSDLLEKDLQRAGSKARVFNVAIPENIVGYGRLLKYAESRGAKAPHLLVGLCVENDLRDYRDRRSVWDSTRSQDASVTKRQKLRQWLKTHSALYTAASFMLQKFSWTRGLAQRMGIARSVDDLTLKNEWNEAVLESSRDELMKIVSGRDTLILIIPSRRLWHGDNIETEKRVHEAFVGMLRNAGLAVVDLKPALEAGGDPLSYYFTTDPHWNARGHALAAHELFSAIQTSPAR